MSQTICVKEYINFYQSFDHVSVKTGNINELFPEI